VKFAYAIAVLDFDGPAPQLENVNFTWFRPDLSIAKFEGIKPESNGWASSNVTVDAIGEWWVNATYSGDPTIYNNRSLRVLNNSWSGTVYAEDNIFSGVGLTLTIDPGTEVRFSSNASLHVQGTLVSNDVLFTSNSTSPGSGDWEGIIFHSTSDPFSVFQNNTVEYAYKGLLVSTIPLFLYNNTFRYSFEGARLFSSSALISTNHFSYNTVGIRLYGSPAIIEHNIMDNNMYGIECETAPNMRLSDNTITSTGQTAVYVSDSTVEVINNTIDTGGGAGLYFADSSVGNIENTRIRNLKDGISARDDSTVTVIDSNISSNQRFNIYVDSSYVFAIDYPFSQKLFVVGDGILVIANYLTVSVNVTTGAKVSGATVSVYDNDVLVDHYTTDINGITAPILVIDRTHNSTGMYENVTKVEVSSTNLAFADNSRLVDMFYSHTEFFTGSPDDNDGDGDPDFSDLDDDNDELLDVVEIILGTNPFDSDTDDDELTDGFEYNDFGSDPLLIDTDEDGYSDKQEHDANTSPTDPDDYPGKPPTPPEPDDDGVSIADDSPIILVFVLEAVAFLLVYFYFLRLKKIKKSK